MLGDKVFKDVPSQPCPITLHDRSNVDCDDVGGWDYII